MESGSRLPACREDLDVIRSRFAAERDRLPARLLALEDAEPPYEVTVSEGLERFAEEVTRRVENAPGWHGATTGLPTRRRP
jgi:nicotinate phosphoribosyltransferase